MNKSVYRDLESILQVLDIRLYVNMFAIVKREPGNERILKLRKALSNEATNQKAIEEDDVSCTELLRQLGLPEDDPALTRETLLTESLNFSRFVASDSDDPADDEEISMDELTSTSPMPQQKTTVNVQKWKIIHSHEIGTAWDDQDEEIRIRYIFTVEEADLVTRKLFYTKPHVSFLRMVLDYFFMDYYMDDGCGCFLIGPDNETRYKETSTGFCQRLARLFMGKLQGVLSDHRTLSDIESMDKPMTEDPIVAQYYIYDFMEKIDGIASKTYEGDSPFGCIMLLNEEELDPNDGTEPPVRYSVQFHSDNRVSLGDTRRIRKLLELTNNENDFYLIGNENWIYGIGEIDWKSIDRKLLIKIEFKGLSNYDVLLVSTGEMEYTEGSFHKGTTKKVYEMTARLEIISEKLINVSFKKPEIGDGGFTQERFRGIVKDQFRSISKRDIERLESLVLQTKGIRHGAMIVITEPETAKEELRNLNRQSTPIISSPIRPELVKHLTSIDGAIYFDTSGICHAIGVILDGEAAEHLGDSSRGARYNSAFRYMNKLKGKGKSCVIAIISEDGMVNLIPEPPSEAMIRNKANQLLDTIMLQQNSEVTEQIKRYSRELTEYERYVHYSYFYKLAEAFRNKSMLSEALEYYHYAIDAHGGMKLELKRGLARTYFKLATQSSGDSKFAFYKQLIEECNSYMKPIDQELLLSSDFSRRGTGYAYLGIGNEAEESVQKEYLQNAIDDLTEALSRRNRERKKKRKNNILYANRSYVNYCLNRLHESIEDIIEAELDEHNEDYLKFLFKFINGDFELFYHAIHFYREKTTKKRFSKELEERFESHSLYDALDKESAASQTDLESDEEQDDNLT